MHSLLWVPFFFNVLFSFKIQLEICDLSVLNHVETKEQRKASDQVGTSE
jgi:hypothetical protein